MKRPPYGSPHGRDIWRSAVTKLAYVRAFVDEEGEAPEEVHQAAGST
jgi:hypothetical protein